MKRYILLSVIAIALALMSCSRHGKYESNGEIVRYTYWTFSFGTLYDTLPGADAKTFKSVNEWLGHDARRVYFKNHPVDGVDVATVKADHFPLFHDKNDYYYKTTPMRVADMSTFKVVKRLDDSFWARDSQYAYFDTTKIAGVDLPTFKVKSEAHAVDKNNVYRFGELLKDADPATYDENWKGFYSRDKSHIWYMGDLIEDADYATFVVDDDMEAHDCHGAFHASKRVN